ncbi:MAG: SDR family NAD(P)-dependent oxidoreductase, partial [Sphingopyxis sp.]
MGQMLIFGMGYAASHLARRLEARGWDVTGTTRDGRAGSIAFGDDDSVRAALRTATHILSSVPPAAGTDPVLARYGDAIALAPATWTGYLSSTGVYGDARGAWVDESAPVRGRRPDRNAADAAWTALR